MALSCFTPCGLLEFSSEKPIAQVIYEQIQRSHGPAYDSENFNGVLSAKWYADSMAYAAAYKTLQRAKNQAAPYFCSDLLPAHERHYRIVPAPSATLKSRHDELAAAMLLPLGPRRGNVEYQLRAALGADFVAWVTNKAPRNTGWAPTGSGVPDYSFPVNPETQGIFNNPALWKTIRFDEIAWPGTVTVHWSHVSGDLGTIAVGDQLLVAPGELGQQEKVTVTGRTDTTLTAAFTRPHETSTVAIRRPWPFWLSTMKNSCVVVKNGRAKDQVVRQKICAVLEKVLSAVSTWDIVDENATPGSAGPWIPGAGTWRVGLTPHGKLTF